MDTSNNFFIPKQITIGYQKRNDTYTGKLAYVIYTDQKGKLRKETSWNSWRDKKISTDTFNNIPTSGFVLNKHVGGHKSDWNFRQSYCRIYDPRGFEFEITIDNLLYILDWAVCDPGKGLDGQYVYGWQGENLALIPCNTEDYKVSKEMSDKMYEPTNTSDLVPGALYKTKAGDFVFIGKLKTQQKLGKSYKSQLYFYCPNGNRDKIFTMSASSILCKLSDAAISEDTINEIVYRFSLSAYSYDFWHTNNIIDHFESSNNYLENTLYGDYYCYCHYYRNIGKISEDTKSVDLYKAEYYTEKEDLKPSDWRTRYKTMSRQYKFITLNNDTTTIKYSDFGHADDFIFHNWAGRDYAFNSIYRDAGATNQSDAEYLEDDLLTQVYYVTKDGYYSQSLQHLLGCAHELSFVSDMRIKEIYLPIKINKV